MTRPARILLVLGSVLLLLGIIAGVANREVLDGSQFAHHVDEMRSDPAVSRQVGIVISDQAIRAAPDLTIARPLVESTASALVGSSAFGPVVRAAVAPVHGALITDGDSSVVLRLADVGAVLLAALSTIAPDVVDSLPPDLDVTLATFGEEGFGSGAVGYAHLVKLLSWLLPLLALLSFAGVVVLAKDRVRGLRSVGFAIATTGLVVAAGVFVGEVVASRVDTDSLASALGVAAWNELSTPLWLAAGVVAAAGYVLVIGSVLRLGADPRAYVRQAVSWLLHPPRTQAARAAHGAVLLGLGVAGVLRPLTVLTVLVVIAGFVVAVQGLVELAQVARRPDKVGTVLLPRLLGRPEVRTALVAGAGLAVVAGLVAWNAQPPSSAVAEIGAADDSACNGSRALCDRRFDQIAFPATHNSMSAADEPGWFLAEQPTGIIGQLDDGIRVLLFDTWPGQTTSRAGVVANTEASRRAAFAEATEAYGAGVLASALRLRDATDLTPTGSPEPYLCHALCELGSTKLAPVMAEVRTWMQAHPREVVTFFVQDEVAPDDMAKVMDQAGLLPMTQHHVAGEPWPTLGQMIDSGKRLVVLAENRGGGTTHPWLLQGFEQVQDTPYDAKRRDDFSCDRLRGPADASLFLVNHWLNRPQRRVSDAATVNAAPVLGPRLDACRTERGRIPNFVAVDYYDHGDLFDEIDRLNGVR